MRNYDTIIRTLVGEALAFGKVTDFVLHVDQTTLRDMQTVRNFWVNAYDPRSDTLNGIGIKTADVVIIDEIPAVDDLSAPSSNPVQAGVRYPRCLAIAFTHPVTGRTTYIDSDISDPIFTGD